MIDLGDFDIKDWQQIKNRALETLEVLPHFLKNPIQGMRNIPDWDWPNIIILQLILAISSGFVGGIVGSSFLRVLWGIFMFPIISVLVTIIGAALIYYCILFIFRKELDYRKLYLNLLFASIPFIILKIIAHYFSFVDLIGYAMMLLLVSMGLVENFGLEKKPIIRLMGVFYALFFITWLFTTAFKSDNDLKEKKYAEPQSLDLLEKELGNAK